MTLKLQSKLLKRERAGNLRKLSLPSPNLIDFSSNDYLGLANAPLTISHLGSTGSRLLTGNTHYAQDLEDKIATFHGFETGLLFNCGYMANLGLLSAIADKKDCIFFDANVHASTRHGIFLSKAKAYPFKHNDTAHLEQRLKHCVGFIDRFICIESIYSTDGRVAPLVEIAHLARKYDAHLIVDEAHAIGVYGHLGRGIVAELELSSFVFAQIITFGKALGTFGAIVLGNKVLRQALINFAPSFIYTTALPIQNLAAIHTSYQRFPKMEKERRQLKTLIKLFRDFIPNASETHVQSIAVEGNQAAKKLSQKLAKHGFDVRPLLSPTVQRGKEVLRICLHAFNTENELKTLLNLVI